MNQTRSLLICGRPDGRLTALTTAEASVCLAVNQASSIQSIGGTCESMTIGHNPSKLPLSHKSITLEMCRPKFLCEKILDEVDENERNRRTIAKANDSNGTQETSMRRLSSGSLSLRRISLSSRRSSKLDEDDGLNRSRSSSRLLGAYSNLEQDAHMATYSQLGDKAKKKLDKNAHVDAAMGTVINKMIRESRSLDHMRHIFDQFDSDGSGELDLQEFKDAYRQLFPNIKDAQLEAMFEEADLDKGGTVDFDEFTTIARIPQSEVLGKLGTQNRDERGLVQVEQSKESFFGEQLRKNAPKGVGAFLMSESQKLSMELYESRIASMQRFVAMTVMFHQVSNAQLVFRSYNDKTHFSLICLST